MSLYKLLGLARTASKQEIKVAFRKLALQFHPDKHAQSPPQAKAAAAVKFRQISSAYETLSDDRKRAAYDRNPGNVREARRQPKPRNSSSNSARYTSGSNNGGGGGCCSDDTLGWGLLTVVLVQFIAHVKKKDLEKLAEKENDKRKEHSS